MGAKVEKVVSIPERRTVTKVAYTPIMRDSSYGSRMLDVDNDPALFETMADCMDAFAVGEDDCVAIATVTWEEAA